MKQATLDLIKNIDENTFIPPSTKNELFELFQLDTVADLRKVSRNFMKLYEILEHLDGQTSSATTEKAGIVKFGIETGDVIDAETWKQAIGQSLGGYVSKVESKEAGKWYINDLTDGKIYKCIQNHTSKSFDITKFVDITNVGISDKMENLFEFKNGQFKIGNIIFKYGITNYYARDGIKATQFFYDTPFPNNTLFLSATDVGGGANSVSLKNDDNKGFSSWAKLNGIFSDTTFWWLAIGY